jgi:hypothetical protein
VTPARVALYSGDCAFVNKMRVRSLPLKNIGLTHVPTDPIAAKYSRSNVDL